MLSLVDEDNSGEIEFPEFLKVLQNQKAIAASRDDEEDTVGAFVALGGSPDKSGFVSADRLRGTIKDFGLTIDIERLIKEADHELTGMIRYGNNTVSFFANHVCFMFLNSYDIGFAP